MNNLYKHFYYSKYILYWKFLINDEYRILEELNEYEYDKIIYDSNYDNKDILMKYILHHNH